MEGGRVVRPLAGRGKASPRLRQGSGGEFSLHLDLWHLSDCSSLLSATRARSDSSSDATAVEAFITHSLSHTHKIQTLQKKKFYC